MASTATYHSSLQLRAHPYDISQFSPIERYSSALIDARQCSICLIQHAVEQTRWAKHLVTSDTQALMCSLQSTLVYRSYCAQNDRTVDSLQTDSHTHLEHSSTTRVLHRNLSLRSFGKDGQPNNDLFLSFTKCSLTDDSSNFRHRIKKSCEAGRSNRKIIFVFLTASVHLCVCLSVFLRKN